MSFSSSRRKIPGLAIASLTAALLVFAPSAALAADDTAVDPNITTSAPAPEPVAAEPVPAAPAADPAPDPAPAPEPVVVPEPTAPVADSPAAPVPDPAPAKPVVSEPVPEADPVPEAEPKADPASDPALEPAVVTEEPPGEPVVELPNGGASATLSGEVKCINQGGGIWLPGIDSTRGVEENGLDDVPFEQVINGVVTHLASFDSGVSTSGPILLPDGQGITVAITTGGTVLASVVVNVLANMCGDDDKDGILNHVDPDVDGDGVPNADDECPGTPPGEAVDDKGCTVVTVDPIVVAPVAPTFNDTDRTFTIPEQPTGISIIVNGEPIQPGVYPATGTVEIIFTADEGYKLDGESRYTHTFPDEPSDGPSPDDFTLNVLVPECGYPTLFINGIYTGERAAVVALESLQGGGYVTEDADENLADDLVVEGYELEFGETREYRLVATFQDDADASTTLATYTVTMPTEEECGVVEPPPAVPEDQQVLVQTVCEQPAFDVTERYMEGTYISYGSFDEFGPDDTVFIEPGQTVRITTTREEIDYIAYTETGLFAGFGENIKVNEPCDVKPPPVKPKPPVPPATPPTPPRAPEWKPTITVPVVFVPVTITQPAAAPAVVTTTAAHQDVLAETGSDVLPLFWLGLLFILGGVGIYRVKRRLAMR